MIVAINQRPSTMATQLTHYSCSGSCNWEWPVNIALIEPQENQLEALQTFHWIEKFCQFHKIAHDSTHVNLIISEKKFNDTENFINAHYIRCQVIIILVEKEYLSRRHFETEDDTLLKALAKKTGAFGVLIIEKTSDLGPWLNEVIIQLSHNKNICEAIESTSSKFTGIYNYQLDKATTLSYLMDKVSVLLKRRKEPEQGITFNTWHSSQTKYTLQQLSDFLRSNANTFRFDHESDEASQLAELFSEINKKTNSSILKEDFMEYLPGPASAPMTEDRNDGRVKNVVIDFDLDFDKEDADEDGGAGTSRGIGGIGQGHYPVGGVLHKPQKEEEEVKTETPRFLQAIIQDTEDVIQDYLLVSNTYNVLVRIGEYDKNWQQGTQEFPSDEIFTDPAQQQEIVRVIFTSNLSDETRTSDLILKRKGNTRDAVFIIQTPQQSMKFEAEILVFHKQRLIQKARLISFVISDETEKTKRPPTSMDVVSLVNDLQQLSERDEYGSSIYISNKKKKEQHTQTNVYTVSKNKIRHFNFTSALSSLIVSIKKLIQDAVIDLDNYPEDLFNAQNQNLLAQLALLGSDLYVSHFNMNLNFEGPMQIVSHQAEFIPIDFAYTCEAPALNAPVCPNAVKALESGQCCGCDAIRQSPAEVICPLGFYGFNHVIERHSITQEDEVNSGGYQLIAGPSKKEKTIRILNNTLFASTTKMSANDEALKSRLKESLQKNSLHPTEATNWNEWTDMIKKTNPDSLVLLVHLEKDKNDGLNKIEIGDEQLLIQQHLNQQKVRNEPGHHPFVILIGCEVTNVQNYGFDLSSRFMSMGAAIVVTNFTKIRGRQAGPIVMKLLEFLKEHTASENSLGQIILKLRQYFLARGMMAIFSLQTFGDADWKIKT